MTNTWLARPLSFLSSGTMIDLDSLQWRAQRRSTGMISVPDPVKKLGPLCADPDPSHPGACNP